MTRTPAGSGCCKPFDPFVLGRPPTVYTPHDARYRGLLNSKGGLWLSDSLKHQALLLEGSEITLWACQNLNSTFFLLKSEGKPKHSCEEVLLESYAARSALTDHPLENPDLVFCTNGSLLVGDGNRHAGFMVVSDSGIIWVGPLF
jgi:hypothetical protein